MKEIKELKEEKEINKNFLLIRQMEMYFIALEWKYHVYLFISGICLLIIISKLSWASGIGWLFFSKVIAMIIVKIESIIVESHFLKSKENASKVMFNSWN